MMADVRDHEDKSPDGRSTDGDSGDIGDPDANSLRFLKPRPVPTSLSIVLGSSSPFRRAVLEQLGWKFTIASPDIDEKAIRDPDPRRMCAMIARAKAEALMEHLDNHGVLITVDQVCLFDGDDGEEIREKPISVEQARAFLESYSGRSVKTLSAVCVTNLEAGGRRMEGTHESTVVWKDIPAEVVDAVISKGTTMGSAGGFAIEDPDLKQLVKRLDGSTDSVLGLPVDLLCGLIEDVTQNIENV